MCEPWRSVGVASSTPSAPGRSCAVRNVVRPSDGAGGRGEAAGLEPRRGRRARPASRRSAGSMKTQKQTIVDSGLPGRPNTSVSPRRPNHIGLPGLIRTRQKTSSTPQASNAGLTWSCGPTDTPPRHDQHVALQAGVDRRERRLAVVARSRRGRSTSAPARAASRRTISPLDSWIRPGSGGAPSGSSSLPGDDQVQARAPVHRRPRRRRPTRARTAAAASAARPARASTSPACRSSPR